MRLIIATILMMLGLFAEAQVMQQSNTSQVMRRLSASQYLGLPKVCGAPSLPDGLNLSSQDGAMVLDTCNFRVLIWYNSAWKVVKDSASIPTVASYGKNAGRDSTILLLSNGTRFAAKDSVGSGGGSFTMFDTVGYGLKITNDTTPATSSSGGTITYSGGYTIHTFTSSGTFTLTGNATVEYLIVAGGGGGGGGTAGGGGAGGLIAGSTTLASGSHAVTVGAGGAGGAGTGAPGTNGGNSSFNSNTAIGGGGGGNNSANGLSGGSGGGAGFGNTGGSATSGQGYAGGSAIGSTGPNYGSAGGGGAGAVGSVGTSTTGGNGGAGALSSISGTPTYYAGGGGGGTYGGGTLGTGGIGGGGDGGAGNGTPNTGGGGGGQKGNSGASAGSGGSGVVIIRYIASVADTSARLEADTSILATKALQVASYGKNTGGDSTVLTLVNGTRFAAKDSVGSGGSGGITGIGSFSGTGNAKGLSISGTDLIAHPADLTNPGMVSTGAQTFAGAKTFTGDIKPSGTRIDWGNTFSPEALLMFNDGTNKYGWGLTANRMNFFIPTSTQDYAWRIGSSVSGTLLATLSGTGSFNANSFITSFTTGQKIGYYGSSAGVGIRSGHLDFFTFGSTQMNWHFTGALPTATSTATLAMNENGMAFRTSGVIQASAAFEVASTNSGFLPPRMTAAQANAISSPAEGLMVYVTNTGGTPFNFTSKGWWGYNGTTWEKLNN